MNQITSVNDPLISIILPIRNVDKFLAESLQSLLTQNYPNIEIIAIDDFSLDKSWKILNHFKKRDTRIRAYKNVKKYGLAITLNRCLKRAKGKYIVFMDPKDTITKNKLQKQLSFLLENPKVVAVGTQCIYMNNGNKRIGKSSYPSLHEHISEKPLHGISILFEGIMVNKYKIPKDFLRFSTYKQLFLYTDMTMKLLQYGQIANLSEYLQYHRKTNLPIETTAKHFFSLLKLWINARFENGETPSFRSFFGGFFKPTT